jgi:tRNA (uracil-5-)-methyltransferase
VMRALSFVRHGLLLLTRSIMQESLSTLTSPSQAPVLSSDKRPRSTSPTQATTRSTAPKRRKKPKRTPPEPGTPEDVVSREVVGLLGSEVLAQAEADGLDWESPFGFREEVELTVSSLSSSGT